MGSTSLLCLSVPFSCPRSGGILGFRAGRRPGPKMAGRAGRVSMDAVGIRAFSHWLSAATPPVAGPPWTPCIPVGMPASPGAAPLRLGWRTRLGAGPMGSVPSMHPGAWIRGGEATGGGVTTGAGSIRVTRGPGGPPRRPACVGCRRTSGSDPPSGARPPRRGGCRSPGVRR